MYKIRIKQFTIGVILGLTLATGVFAQSSIKGQQRPNNEVASRQKQKMSGLFVDVVGRTNNSGYLVAERIRFTKTALMVASAVGARVDRVERRVAANEANDEEQAVQIEQSVAAAKV